LHKYWRKIDAGADKKLVGIGLTSKNHATIEVIPIEKIKAPFNLYA
jgi:hypothetical protein